MKPEYTIFKPKQAQKKQSGFGMLEVLIALLVLSIGLLGIAALQIVSLKNNHSSMSRSLSTISAYTILDAMRADRTSALAGSYDFSMPSSISASTCKKSGTTLQDVQINDWLGQIQQNLGTTACGSIDCTTTPNTCSIVIQFDDSRATNGSSTQTITTNVRI